MNMRFLSTRFILSAILILLLGVGLGYAQQPDNPDGVSAPQGMAGTAFTYQGLLKKGGIPVTATCDFIFDLTFFPAGPPIGPLINKPVCVNNGLFSVSLDSGSGAFNGDGRWLGIQIQCLSEPSPIDLGHQELTPAPLALALPGLWTQQNATNPNLIGGYIGNSITSGVFGATISGGGQAVLQTVLPITIAQ